jgi:hypothetical protein
MLEELLTLSMAAKIYEYLHVEGGCDIIESLFSGIVHNFKYQMNIVDDIHVKF